MANGYRSCICCGTEYRYCSHCSRDRRKPAWMTLYCSDNCQTIFDTANRYGFDLLTKEEAKAIIEKCDLTNLETFNETVKNDVKKILHVEKAKKVAKNVE